MNEVLEPRSTDSVGCSQWVRVIIAGVGPVGKGLALQRKRGHIPTRPQGWWEGWW